MPEATSEKAAEDDAMQVAVIQMESIRVRTVWMDLDL